MKFSRSVMKGAPATKAGRGFYRSRLRYQTAAGDRGKLGMLTGKGRRYGCYATYQPVSAIAEPFKGGYQHVMLGR